MDQLDTIIARAKKKDPHWIDADHDPYRERAREVAHRPETEGYLNDESRYWYVRQGLYVRVGRGRTEDRWGLPRQAVVDGWFAGLREVLHDAYWQESHLIFEPLEAASLDIVVLDGPIARGQLYQKLVEIQYRDSSFRHSPERSLAQNAHEAVGVPLYAAMISIGGWATAVGEG